MRRFVGCWSLILIIAGCGDCGDRSAADRGDLEADSGADGVVATDGAAEDGDDAARDADGGDDRCEAGRTFCDGTCVDTETDPAHCGGCDQTCSAKQRCTDGACECPRYHDLCDGECVATNFEPDNCGECGNTCESSKVCSAGSCADSCLPGRTACGQRCVDTANDPDNCGSCGEECADGEGCLDGSCEPAIEVGDAPDKCTGGGPQIDIQPDGSDRKRCLGNVAKTVFQWGICSCEDLIVDDALRSDAYDSTLGRYRPGGLGGNVGTNTKIDAGSDVGIRGALWASGDGGATFDDGADVHQQLHVGGTADFGSLSDVRKAGFVEDDVVADDGVQFHQSLNVNRQSSVGDGVTYGTLNRTNVNVPTACERCGPSERIPVGDIVSAHSEGNNDNGLIGLDPDALASQGGDTLLELPCGEYYLSEITVDDKITIVADGRTALYIDGDVDVGSDLTIKATPNGELDVFIAGNLYLDDEAHIGDPAYPAATRFYVGGTGGMDVGSDTRFGAFAYAVPGGIVADDKLTVFGAVYTQLVDAGGDTVVHYDRAILDAGESCKQPDPVDPDPEGDAGMDATTDDGGQMDAGDSDDTCRDSGDSCVDDADCCAPLVCGVDGTCDVKACRAIGESCDEDSDCCSGTCATSGPESTCIGS